MLPVKTYHKIKFLKFSENQSWILAFKDIIAQYLRMDKLVQERHILFKVSIKLQMELYQIKELLIPIMIKEGFFQDNLSIYLQRLEGSKPNTNFLKKYKNKTGKRILIKGK